MPLRLTFQRLLRRGLKDETGAVTADWVVLTAITVGLAGALMTILEDPINNGGMIVANKIAEAD